MYYKARGAAAGVSECPPHALVTRVGEVVVMWVTEEWMREEAHRP